MTKQRVEKELLARYPDILESRLQDILEAVFPVISQAGTTSTDGVGISIPSSQTPAKKIFGVLVLLDRPIDITYFTSAGFRDNSLPISTDDLQRIWPHGAVEEFDKIQWRFIAPYFSLSSNQAAYHYQLETNTVLPWVCDDKSSSDLPISGGFGNVWRVKIHPEHHRWNTEESGPKLVCQAKPYTWTFSRLF